MKRADLIFDRPAQLAATAPAELRGLARDEVRLMVSTPTGHHHARFRDLASFLEVGDLLVVNHSATLCASLPATGSVGDFTLSLSTNFGQGLWIAEPRWSPAKPGPMPIQSGEQFEVAGLQSRFIQPYPGLERLWFTAISGDVFAAMNQFGSPIRYSYVNEAYPLDYYQTIFAQVPGSAEMPSAAYPFTQRVLDSLTAKGVQIAGIVLHTGVSSLEVEAEEVESHPLYPEPFSVPAETANAVNRARREGRRVIAVGTTSVRALESAWDGRRVRAASGFTRVYIHPRRGVHVVDGLISG
ncbi:MAG: S-adenosylmethionine:tRNA ribosyltransferase-isomerase, partial [Anaerolineae bacterium]|nr:S-adenosylmethionine:tRNA ribosyltransferase-isomerase [Anaerolineae bacterium]